MKLKLKKRVKEKDINERITDKIGRYEFLKNIEGVNIFVQSMVNQVEH